jgi:hypothetical protein
MSRARLSASGATRLSCWWKLIVSSLIAGMVLNILTTWLFALVGTIRISSNCVEDMSFSGNYAPDQSQAGLDVMTDITILKGVGSCRVYVGFMRQKAPGYGMIHAESLALVPHWATALLNEPLPLPTQRMMKVADARGWPCPSLCSEILIQSPSAPASFSGCVPFTRTVSDRDVFTKNLCLPLRPIPSGFIINTVAYGIIVFVVQLVTACLRSCWRRRRGLCDRCGYDLRGITEQCPECGYGMDTDGCG